MTLLTAFKNKQILVLGAGLTGMSCIRFLAAQGLSFAVNDSRIKPFSADYTEQQFSKEFEQVTLSLGQWDSALIADADVILISPGIDSSIADIAQFIKNDCQVLGDVELFCQMNNQRSNPIAMLAVTGSNGKSTVVSLLDYLAKALGVNAQLGGNIGQPVLDLLTQVHNSEVDTLPELLILELSSFQLETLKSMRAIATTVLNVSDDHLDRHHSMTNYQAIKQGIYPQGNIAVINRDDAATAVVNSEQKPKQQISFGSDAPSQGQFGVRFEDEQHQNNKAYLAFGDKNLIALDELPLAGIHNALNYLAALALGYSAGWSLAAMVENLTGFTGLPHRCQRINTQDGITWINDSKATNVGATLAAINGLAKTLSAEQGLILIAGGDGKGADFTPLTEPLAQQVSQVITLGKDGDKIANLTAKSTQVSDLMAAVTLAKANAKAGDIVLLSPACASLDMFKNFVHRGEQFIAAVENVTEVEA
jgi:UDP-N-acetylmuramoylalanine--D-glutamate ligase